MKTLDKKLFVGLKYLIILIPLFVALCTTFNSYVVNHNYTKVIATERDVTTWQYIDGKYDDNYGGDIVGAWTETNDNLPSFQNEFVGLMNDIARFLPHYSIRFATSSIDVNPITNAYIKIMNITTISQFNQFNLSIINGILNYLYFVIIIELIWVLVILFKWFIQFGYGLFEKERKL